MKKLIIFGVIIYALGVLAWYAGQNAATIRGKSLTSITEMSEGKIRMEITNHTDRNFILRPVENLPAVGFTFGFSLDRDMVTSQNPNIEYSDRMDPDRFSKLYESLSFTERMLVDEMTTRFANSAVGCDYWYQED